MMYFAALTLTEFIPLVTVLAGMLIGFYGLLKYILTQAEKDRSDDREERKEFSMAIKELTKSNIRVAEATETAAKEAKQRNGHLAELTIDSKKATLDAIACIKLKQNVKEQHVDNQTVEHETVTNKEVS